MTFKLPTTIQSLSVTDFRLWEGLTTDLSEQTHLGIVIRLLEGMNGAGKSSFIEAVVFALTGRDSAGGQAPIHLIRTGAPRAVVLLKTDNWVIERSITQKNNGTLKFSRIVHGQQLSPAMTQITQTELRELFGMSETLMIASMIPGYFMRQPADKRLALLSEVTPRIDRNALVAEMCGNTAAWVVGCTGDLNKKPKVPHYTVVAFKRLEKQKRKSFLEGKCKLCHELLVKQLDPVQVPPEMELYNSLEYATSAKLKYKEDLFSYTRNKSIRESILEENSKKLQLEKDLTDQIAECLSQRQLHSIDRDGYNALKSSLKEYPPMPALKKVPDFDHCSTCGQAVGSAYKEKVHVDNEAVAKAYEDAVQAVKDYNHPFQVQLDKLYFENLKKDSENQEIQAENKHKQSMRISLERQLASCAPMPVPEEPMPPEPPKVVFTDEEVRRIRSVCENYYKAKGAYKKDLEARMNAKDVIEEVLQEIEGLIGGILAYEYLEVALRDLPQREADMKRDFFKLRLSNITLSTDNGVEIFDENLIPYECMSSGQRMRVDVELCIALQGLMGRMEVDALPRVAVLFVDNFDLADWKNHIGFPEFIREVFYAHVCPKQFTLTLDGEVTTSQ